MAGVNKSAGACDSRGTDKGLLYPLLLSAASASLNVASKLLFFLSVLRYSEQSLWITWHYTEEMKIGFPSRHGPDSPLMYSHLDLMSLQTVISVTCNGFWWKWEGKKRAWIVLSPVSLNIVWTFLTSRHFDLDYNLHFYAYISSCALSVLSKHNCYYYYYYFSIKSLIKTLIPRLYLKHKTVLKTSGC